MRWGRELHTYLEKEQSRSSGWSKWLEVLRRFSIGTSEEDQETGAGLREDYSYRRWGKRSDHWWCVDLGWQCEIYETIKKCHGCKGEWEEQLLKVLRWEITWFGIVWQDHMTIIASHDIHIIGSVYIRGSYIWLFWGIYTLTNLNIINSAFLFPVFFFFVKYT